MYDPKSGTASEFINDAEILETIEYAKRNKDNLELIEAIVEKAKKNGGADASGGGGSFGMRRRCGVAEDFRAGEGD